MKLKMTCPFCGEDHCVVESENGYHCTSCEYDFTDDDIEHEKYRQSISNICSAQYAREDKPIKCDIVIDGDEAVGLSDLEKPRVEAVFHDSEGIVWIKVYGMTEPMEGDKLTTSDLKNIYDALG